MREWVSNAIVGEPDARPALTHLPAPGSLLVASKAGTAIVRDDGSRRVLGDFGDSSWSPHGLYVAAADGRRLKAIAANGDLRWSVTSDRRVSDPAWSPNEGYRVAYRSGDELRVVWGDGTNDARLGSATEVAPAWRPRTGSRNVLAYADGAGRVRITDTDSGRSVYAGTTAAPTALGWTRDGSQLFVLHRDSLQVLDGAGRQIWRTEFPPGRVATAATFVPGTEAIAAVLEGSGAQRTSELVFVARRGGGVVKRRLFTGTGRFQGLAASPDGRELLLGWPTADQWLFIPTLYSNRIDAVDNIRRQFGTGRTGGFPRVDGWCCQSR